MSFEQQKNTFLKIVNHMQDLNELLTNNNCNVELEKVATNLDNKEFNLDTSDMNVYLSSLLLLIFNLKDELLKINKDNISQLIVINFVNTVLEEINIKQIDFEVI